MLALAALKSRDFEAELTKAQANRDAAALATRLLQLARKHLEETEQSGGDAADTEATAAEVLKIWERAQALPCTPP